MLTVKEVAELKGCSHQNIKKQILDGKLKATETLNNKNRKMYLVDPRDLPEMLKMKYYASVGLDVPELVEAEKPSAKLGRKKDTSNKSLDDCTAAEREEIALWCEILKRWQRERVLYDKVTDADEDIIGAIRLDLKKRDIDLQISTGILYRKFHYYKNHDLVGLLDDRGGWNKGSSSIPDFVWEAFLWFYHDDRQPSMMKCYRDTVTWSEMFYPDVAAFIPSSTSFFRRYKREIPKAISVLMRKGEKAMTDECMQYIERLYDDLEANDVWVADNHTLDIITKYDDGSERTHRLSLTAFMDAKSGIITGWNLTDNPCSQSTIFALRMGILRFGLPDVILFDNGREFTVKDIGGKGHRRRKSDEWDEVPPTILEQLQITARFAKVHNARAKHIERFFLNFKNNISKSFETYIGGNIMERPESAKSKLKAGKATTDSELRAVLEDLIDAENMNEYGGAEKRRFIGMSKLDVWNESIKRTKQRIVLEEDLNLLLMRTSGYQKVKRKGVYITVAGEKIWYSHIKAVWHLDEEVYVRYDPTDLRTVRIYDKEDRYIDTWQVDTELMLHFFDEDGQAVADANKKLASQKKMVKDHAKHLTAGMAAHTKIDILALTVERAQQKKKGMYIAQSDVIEVLRAKEEESLHTLKHTKKTGTDNIVSIDIARMNKNAERRKGL